MVRVKTVTTKEIYKEIQIWYTKRGQWQVSINVLVDVPEQN